MVPADHFISFQLIPFAPYELLKHL